MDISDRLSIKKISHIHLVILLILALAIFLRFYNITERGIFLSNEGTYLDESKFITTSIQHLLDNTTEVRGVFPMSGRIGHNIIISLSMLLFGIHDYSGNISSATLGVGSVLFIFLIGKDMFDTRTGLVASSILAVSAYHIMYSRGSLVEISSTFFLIIGMYLYYLNRKNLKDKYLWLSGFFLGVAFVCDFRLWLMAPLIILYELHLWWSRRDLKLIFKRLITLVSFMLIPIILCEVPYHFAMILDKHSRIVPSYDTYFERLRIQFFHGMYKGSLSHDTFSAISHLDLPLTYFYLLFRLEGIFVCALLSIGLYTTIKKHSLEDLIIGSWFILPFVFYTFYGEQNARFFSFALPAIALISARAFHSLNSKKLIMLLISLVLIFGVWNSMDLLSMKSGYREAFAWLEGNNGQRHVSTQECVSLFYFGRELVLERWTNLTADRLKKSCMEDGYCHILIDTQYRVLGELPHYTTKWRPKVLVEIEEKCEPVYISRHEYGDLLQYFFEHNFNFADTYTAYRNSNPDKLSEIRIYDLRKCQTIFQDTED